MGVPKGGRELWSLRAKRARLQQLSPKIRGSRCISSPTSSLNRQGDYGTCYALTPGAARWG